MSRNDSGSEPETPPVECTLPEERRPERAARGRQEFLPHLESIDYREAVATFVRREADCCSFARCRIDYAPRETLSLTVAGAEGTRELYEEGFESEFRDDLDAADVSLPGEE